MCTSIIEIARAEGMAKRGDEWFTLSQAVVAYDHARHAPLGDVITLDFVNTGLGPGARAGIELTLETAKELRAALDRAIAAAELEEAEVRGKGAVLSLVRSWMTLEMSQPRCLPAVARRTRCAQQTANSVRRNRRLVFKSPRHGKRLRGVEGRGLVGKRLTALSVAGKSRHRCGAWLRGVWRVCGVRSVRASLEPRRERTPGTPQPSPPSTVFACR
jgi:hypothetical protein